MKRARRANPIYAGCKSNARSPGVARLRIPRGHYGFAPLRRGRYSGVLAGLGLSCGFFWMFSSDHAISHAKGSCASSAPRSSRSDERDGVAAADNYVPRFARIHSIAGRSGARSSIRLAPSAGICCSCRRHLRCALFLRPVPCVQGKQFRIGYRRDRAQPTCHNDRAICDYPPSYVRRRAIALHWDAARARIDVGTRRVFLCVAHTDLATTR
jgi:hypothetical protein